MGLFSKLAALGKQDPEELKAENLARLTDWGLSHVIIRGDAQILSAGLGDGTDLEKLLSLAFVGHVTGIDNASLDVEQAKELAQWAITERKCSIVQGNASALPFLSDSFDFVTSFDPEFIRLGGENAFSEIRRVLKKGGSFLMVCGPDNTEPFTADELRKLFRSADFGLVKIDDDSERKTLAAVAVK